MSAPSCVTLIGALLFHASLLACSADSPAVTAPMPAAAESLDAALLREDLPAVQRAVAQIRLQLGARAGVPESAEPLEAIPAAEPWLTVVEARSAFVPYANYVAARAWWRIGLDPTQLNSALREPAAFVSGATAAAAAGLDDSARNVTLARVGADFLLWAQAQAGTGVFPFPAVRGNASDGAFIAADQLLARAAREGRTGEMVRNGWIAADLYADGGLQFDNAEAAVAVLELWKLTGDARYLAAARQAGDWALGQRLVMNWNYNSFSVYLLAELFAATGDVRYLNGAVQKARIGVLPGQLQDGANAGRWLDPHNAKATYHYIMMRSLAALLGVLPEEHPHRAEVQRALVAGLRARNEQILGQGAATRNKAIEALLIGADRLGSRPDVLAAARAGEALDALGRLASRQMRAAPGALGPRETGLFLAHVMQRTAAQPAAR